MLTVELAQFRVIKPALSFKSSGTGNNIHFYNMRKASKPSYRIILRHLLFWMGIILYEVVNEGWKSKDIFSFKLQPEFISIIPIAMLLTYFNFYGLMPLFYFHKKFASYLAALAVLLIIGGCLQRFCSYAFWIPWGKVNDPGNYYLQIETYWNTVRILRNAFLFFPIIAVTMLIKIMRNAMEQEKSLRKMEIEKLSAEISLLKAQINPHFFFNTLNSLYALTLKGSEKASQVVLRLSDLMHYMLYEASASRVLLTDEIEHLSNYIHIEEMRFAGRMELSFQYSGDIDDKLISPLILLPFIENAFKHGITKQSGWITISINVIGHRLFLKVENSCVTPTLEKPGGLGLINVKRRLDLIYAGDYELELNQYDGVFEADLKLNL
ncbi:sensor histidine kinase [Pedobacter sp. L105]|uniref:sensor histidine kinase n=1 Tax=Pedobacter sp. L105 TaxID=1641871 RepID=UPI00131C7532|nr:histidine kinase [Pedobacter sp. L105]